jgi:soluble lytic murein transglycosylase-like protein
MSSFTYLLLSVSLAAQADIYEATGENGINKWSTQALNSSYQKSSVIEEISWAEQKLVNDYFSVKAGKNIESTINPLKNREYRSMVFIASNKHGVDPALVEALISVESGFNTYAISPKGARGLMQLMPATAKRYGMKSEQELHIPSKNIDMGVRHLKDLLKLHDGQVALAIASYNAGQGAVSKHGQRIPAYRETMLYVPAVLSYMARSTSDAQSVSNTALTVN